MTNRQNRVIIAGFLMMIFGFTAGSMVSEKRDFSEKENRVLQQMPDLNLEDLFSGEFAQKYEKYLSDQFFHRDGWIGLKTGIDRGIGKQEANGVYFAKDGYLIEHHNDDFKGPAAIQNLQTAASFVESWNDAFGKDHIKVCIVPNAVDILSDKLPAFVKNTIEKEYFEKVREIIPEENLLDVEDLLSQHKEEELYYHTDHHWTTTAARYVYKAWADAIDLPILQDEDYDVEILTEDFYGTVDAKVSTPVKPDTILAYMPKRPIPYELTYNHQEQRESLYDKSYLEKRDKYAVFFGGNQPLIEARTEAGRGRKLLILKDSYANCFLSFAMQDFDEIDIVDLRYLNENLKDLMQEKEYTDMLLLYNASGFAGDTSISKLSLAMREGEES